VAVLVPLAVADPNLVGHLGLPSVFALFPAAW
jgi:hypothetical protein